MRYRANARVVSPGGKEIGRVSYIVKARNKSQALAKLRQMLKAKNRKRKKNGASSAERKAASRMARHRMRK